MLKSEFLRSSKGRTGACLPEKWRCDGIVQCPTTEDELNCPLATSIDLDSLNFQTSDIVEVFVDNIYVSHENFPFHYENNKDRRQTFVTGPDMVFMVKFELFHLELDRTTATCADYLKFQIG